MTKDYYKSYNHKSYVHYRHVTVNGYTPQTIDTENGKSTRINPNKEKRIIPFEDIKSLRLDKIGTLHPQLDTEDYFIVGNYIMDFWGAIMGSDAVSLYLHLLRHAYGKKDYCYPDIEFIALKMSRSRNYIKKQIGILENYNFIMQFNRYDITDNNREVSPLFKIRRLIPLITDEMYQSLHPKLQEEHDNFMKDYDELSFTSNFSDTLIDDIVKDRDSIVSKKVRKKIESIIKSHDKHNYVIDRITGDDRIFTYSARNLIKEKVSKPSYETWFEHIIFIKTDDEITIVVDNEFAKDWIDSKYIDLLKEWLDIKDYSISVTIIDNYMEEII